jgi:hypothetical protein
LAEELVSYLGDLDDHVRLYGMRVDEFEFTKEISPTCENRIGELGLCGHGIIGGGLEPTKLGLA